MFIFLAKSSRAGMWLVVHQNRKNVNNRTEKRYQISKIVSFNWCHDLLIFSANVFCLRRECRPRDHHQNIVFIQKLRLGGVQFAELILENKVRFEEISIPFIIVDSTQLTRDIWHFRLKYNLFQSFFRFNYHNLSRNHVHHVTTWSKLNMISSEKLIALHAGVNRRARVAKFKSFFDIFSQLFFKSYL